MKRLKSVFVSLAILHFTNPHTPSKTRYSVHCSVANDPFPFSSVCHWAVHAQATPSLHLRLGEIRSYWRRLVFLALLIRIEYSEQTKQEAAAHNRGYQPRALSQAFIQNPPCGVAH